MQVHLIPYFTAEKQEALLFMAVGIAAIGLTLWLLKTGSRYRAAGFPLVAIAAIQITVGSTVYFRTDNQVAELTTQFEKDVATFQADEVKRMQIVIDNFVIYRYIEIVLLFIGLLITIFLREKQNWHATGLGLTAQSGIMLALDYFAEARAAEYMQFLQDMI